MMVSSEGLWEHGSFFDARHVPDTREPEAIFDGAVLFGSGRGALRAAIEHGRKLLGWRRLIVPTYYCHDVTHYLESHIEMRLYDHGPTSLETAINLEAGEVALVVEYFGARATVRVEGGDVLLDRTHDPLAAWEYERSPRMTFASLRKTLPLADGGAIWPAKATPGVEPPPSQELESASAAMRTAMSMKAQYLAGASVSKPSYLKAQATAERALSHAEPGAMTALSRARLRTLPIRELRRRRHQNIATFKRAIGDGSGDLRYHDFPAFIVLSAPDEATRDRVRAELALRRIYSAVLWPLDGLDADATQLDFSDRMLILHADHRYSTKDMTKVAAEVEQVANQLQAEAS